MTSRPAARVGLHDRGVIRRGFKADVTVFDPPAIRDVSTFDDPNHYAVGVRHVIVNGRPVLADGQLTAERPGRVLRGPGNPAVTLPRPTSSANLASPSAGIRAAARSRAIFHATCCGPNQ